jgi:hypothetical protein
LEEQTTKVAMLEGGRAEAVMGRTARRKRSGRETTLRDFISPLDSVAYGDDILSNEVCNKA